MRAQYCPQCGGATRTKIPDHDSVPRSTCRRCSWIGYENPRPLVACLLYEVDRLLWIRRGTEPYRGRWALPAGFIECDETASEAGCREIREETGLALDEQTLRLYSLLSLPDIAQIYISLIGPLPSHNYRPTREASEIALLDRQQVRERSLAYPVATLPLIMAVYDFLERPQPSDALGRLYAMRGKTSNES